MRPVSAVVLASRHSAGHAWLCACVRARERVYSFEALWYRGVVFGVVAG